VAILSPNTSSHAETPGTSMSGFLAGLRELGYVDGQNVTLEVRFANHALERLPALAAELLALQPDVLYTFTSGGARVAAAATRVIPVVVAPVNETTIAELVANFAHPAGNITGLTLNSREQHEKCLQLLKEAAPRITRVGVLVNPLNPAWDKYPNVLSDAARVLGLELIRAEARTLAEIDDTFAALSARGADALFALDDSALVSTVPPPYRLLEAIAKHRLPSVSDNVDFAREGGLLALGPDFVAIGRRAATYVHRILQGAQPGELPVEHPTEFRLMVNLKAAGTLGIVIPPALLARADEVIE
jgi:putative ABC transport system substrate-binding protein